MERKIEISTKTIGFAVFLILGMFFVFKVFGVVVALFVSFLFASALSPIVEFVEKLRVPRGISVLLIFLILLSILFLAGALIIPPLVFQLIKFFEKLPVLLSATYPFSGMDIMAFSPQFTALGQNVFKVTTSFFGDIFSFISIFVLTFYMLYERRNIEKVLKLYVGEDKGVKIVRFLRKVEEGLGAWTRGQLVLCVIIGIATYIGLRVLGVDYALPLSIIAGILEMVPVIGPILSAVPAILVATYSSLDLALITTFLYLIIQQAENHLIVPVVMRKATGLSPLITIVAIMVGGNLAGAAGMLLAVPLVVVLHTGLKELAS